MILFALVCGVVTGHAAELALADPGRSASAGRFLNRRWLVLSPNPFLAGSVLVALMCAATLAVVDARIQAVGDQIAGGRMLLPPEMASDYGRARAELARASAACKRQTDDARLQQITADLQVAVYRMEKAAQSRGIARRGLPLPPPQIETSPSYLHGRIHQYARNHRTVDLDDLRNDALVQKHLRPALQHLLDARAACPLLLDTHIRLAELCGLVVDPGNDVEHLRHAATVGAGQAADQYYIGLLHIQAGRTEIACEVWRTAVRVAPELLPQVLEAAKQYVDLTDRRAIASLLPDSPEVLILAARDHLKEEKYGNSRRHVLQQARLLLRQADLPEAERCYLEGIVLGLDAQTLHAVQYLTRAVELSPGTAKYRFQLALLLRQRGLLERARKQAVLCVQIAPDNAQYEQLLRELIREDLTNNQRT
jgi:tetratricopeptide (TPR) repeat protein